MNTISIVISGTLYSTVLAEVDLFGTSHILPVGEGVSQTWNIDISTVYSARQNTTAEESIR